MEVIVTGKAARDLDEWLSRIEADNPAAAQLQKPSKHELDTGSKSLDSIHKPVTDTRNGQKFER